MGLPQGISRGTPRLNELVVNVDKNWLGYLIKNLGQPAEPKDALRQPGDDEKIYFGADSDYSLYYDSTNDEYVIYDEVNATKLMRLPKSKTLNNVLESGGVHELLHSNMNISADDHHAQDHEARHEAGGADEIPSGSLNPQDPTAHQSAHQAGGSDEISTLVNLPLKTGAGDSIRVEEDANNNLRFYNTTDGKLVLVIDQDTGAITTQDGTGLVDGVATSSHEARHEAGGADALPWGDGGGLDADTVDGDHAADIPPWWKLEGMP